MKLLLNITIILSIVSMQYATATDIDCLFHEESSPVTHEHETRTDHEHVKAKSHINTSAADHSEGSSHYHASDDQCCTVTVFFIKSVPGELQYVYAGLLSFIDTIFLPEELMKYAPLIRPPRLS